MATGIAKQPDRQSEGEANVTAAIGSHDAASTGQGITLVDRRELLFSHTTRAPDSVYWIA